MPAVNVQTDETTKKMQEQIDQLKQTLIQVVDNAKASQARMHTGK